MTDREKDPGRVPEAPTLATPAEAKTEHSSPTTTRAADLPISDFGGYRVFEKIGEGGMGEVYRAEQVAPIRRNVALKVIKAGMDTREVIARFESERQALALMNHPGIARVFEAGSTPEGRPFFAMEYIQGVPVTEYADLHRLDVRARLKLFIKVCEAVQHAHQKAILHRDLKPTNVLVTATGNEPEPKVIDFGVAKALVQRLTESTLYTELGRFVGTPEYMSPEQTLGSREPADTRADIYSLGVILYELLVGQRPFDRRSIDGGLDELYRLIREVDPPRPSAQVETPTEPGERNPASTLHSSTSQDLRGDLDWITMKTLEKDPARRYSTAGEFARDIERHLNDEPVLASPPSSTYRLSKFVRRHRSGVAISGVAALAILASLVATTVGWINVRRERDATEKARAEAVQITNFFVDMLESADPAESGSQITVIEILDKASSGIGTSLSEQPLVEAQLRQTIGATYQALGRYEPAEQQLTQALETRIETLGREHPDSLKAEHAFANLLIDQGRYDEAEVRFQSILETRLRTLGAVHKDTLLAQFNLATVYQAQEKYALSEELHQYVLDQRVAALGPDHLDTLDSYESAAHRHWFGEETEKARPLYERVYEGRRQQFGLRHPLTLDALNNLAAVDHIEKKHNRAEERYRQGLEISSEVRGRRHPQTLVMLGNLGELYRDLGRYEEAEDLLLETLEIKHAKLGIDHPSSAYTQKILDDVQASLAVRANTSRADLTP